MSTASQSSPLVAARRSFGMSGVLAVIAGILIVSWPGKTIAVISAIVACWAIAAGIVYAALGVFSKKVHGWSRVGHVVLGVLSIAVGIVAIFNLVAPAGNPLRLLGTLIGILWIVEGAVTILSLPDAPSKGWAIAFAVFSVIAGIVVLVAPVASTLALWWVMGVLLIVLGIMNVVRAFTYRGE